MVPLGQHWHDDNPKLITTILNTLWDIAAEHHQLTECPDCHATWQPDPPDQPCPWCAHRLAQARANTRDQLLRNPLGHDYPADRLKLSDHDFRVWCRTRGLRHENRTAVLREWQLQLRHAVQIGLVTELEAETALRAVIKPEPT